MKLAAAFRAAPIYALYDTQLSGTVACEDVIAAWLRSGLRVIQYRHKGNFERKHFAECQRAAHMARDAGAMLIINDRADVALLSGAAGVHVGQTDLAPADVRKLLPAPALAGLSTHNLEQLSVALQQPVDYVAIGPVFATASKADPDPIVGLETLRQARMRTELPLVAIGGIAEGNLAEVLSAGADAVALITGLVSGCTDANAVERRACQLLARAVTARA